LSTVQLPCALNHSGRTLGRVVDAAGRPGRGPRGRPLASCGAKRGNPMPELAELVDPRHTAVLTMELQRGVSGDLATMPALAQELKDRGVIAAAAAVCRA